MTLLGSRRTHSTAYHPQTNGTVERFHRQLKAALKAQLQPHLWMDALPLVLGIRTALKKDIASTTAEMVYGTTLRLPGEFFTPSQTTSVPDPSMSPTSEPICRPFVLLHPDLHSETATSLIICPLPHVFIRHDALRKPLQPPYDGPYLVIKRTDKHFVKINGRTDTVSIDRLKPAHLDTDSMQPTTQTASPLTSQYRTTRSGRCVHFPQYLSKSMS